jgi:tetratricopeptide (TPR) repeat protein
LVRSLAQLGSLRARLGQFEQAKALLTEAWDLVAPTNFDKLRLYVRILLGELTRTVGQFSEAREHLTQSLQIARDLRSHQEVVCLLLLAGLAYSLQDVEQAIEQCREAIACARMTPGHRNLSLGLMHMTAYLLARGSPEEARPVAEEALSRIGDSTSSTMSCLSLWAVLAAFEGRLTEAAQLISFVDAERVRKRQPRPPPELPLYNELIRRLEAGIPAADLLTLRAEAALWSDAEAMHFTSTRLVVVARGAGR